MSGLPTGPPASRTRFLKASELPVTVEAIPLTNDAIRKVIGRVDLMVNATSVGLHPGDSLGLDPTLFTAQALCVRRYLPAGAKRRFSRPPTPPAQKQRTA